MNTKHIIALVTFVVAFTGASVLVKLLRPIYQVNNAVVSRNFSCSTAQRISQFIEQDVNNGLVRESEVWDLKANSNWKINENSLQDYSFLIENYVVKMEAMNYEALPTDFQNAWIAHKNAWREHADFLNEIKDISGSRISDISNSPTYINGDSEITRTWLEVLRIAKKYNATIPANAY